jgi:uncharacterized membrane protein YdjX (TVP38/TMEM64 family)
VSAVQQSTGPSPLPATGPGPEVEARPPWRKLLFLGALVAVLLALVYLSPLRDYLRRAPEVSKWLRGLGLWAPLAWMAVVTLLSVVGFSRLLLCVIAGMAFGFWWGLLWTQLGTLLGNYVVFLAARKNGGGWAERYLSRHGRLEGIVRRSGIAEVILARQLPVPGLVINLALGLVSIRHRDFLLGTLLGQLPEAVPLTLIGAGILRNSSSERSWLIGGAVVLAVLAWLVLRTALRRHRSRPVPPPPA